MAIITTRQGLIDYCLRSLGAPVVEINVAEEQVDDRIDEAIEHFRLYHYDGIEKVYLKHQLTAADITNQYITLSDLIYGVTRVFPVASGTSTSKSIFDLQYQLRLNDLYDLTSTSIIYYSQVMSHLSLLDMTLNGHPLYRFNKLTNKLYIEASWSEEMKEGKYILVECYRALDPTTVTKMYNDKWLKHFATAQIKKQWATNLKKFSGMQLPGGVTIDGNALYDEAVQEIKDLEDDIRDKSAPLDFYLG
jgi:hypothetical protein